MSRNSFACGLIGLRQESSGSSIGVDGKDVLYQDAMKSLDSRFTPRLLLHLMHRSDSEFAPQASMRLPNPSTTKAVIPTCSAEEYRFSSHFPDYDLADDAQLDRYDSHQATAETGPRRRLRLAEFELTSMLNNPNYSDSPLLNEAKEKLRYVQEVLAESIFGPAKQYYLRRAYPAVIDRCEEITRKYPDFTGMDRVLFLLAESKRKVELPQESVNYYAQIVRDYPLSDLAKESKERLNAMRLRFDANPLH
jgi:hypothetical protein